MNNQFIQQRIYSKENPNLKEADIPWSYWSDGEWRNMEPDFPDGLPLFGLDQIRDRAKIFIHEGAKAAREVADLVNNPARREELRKHPWREALENAAHLGWPGGAPNPYRVDWRPIRALKNKSIYIIADNDKLGREAVPIISKLIGLPCDTIRFDTSFPASFDLADPWPKKLWKSGKYVGPSFEDMLSPATWATELLEVKEQGRPPIVLRETFKGEWLCIVKPAVFVHRNRPNRIYSADELNRKLRDFSDTSDTGKLLVKGFATKYDTISYRPHRADEDHNLEISEDGDFKLNVFFPPVIRPMAGDATPFLDYMEHLIPNDGDRQKVLRWVATFISRPDIFMSYGLLLISQKQGVGKSTLGEYILAPLAGNWNVSRPSEKIVVDSQFNGWRAEKRLAIIHEIYNGKDHKVYDKLKSTITEDNFDAHRKHMEEYNIENWCHILACSNYFQAMKIDDDDRRWLVPQVTEEGRPHEYWEQLHNWLNADGLAIIHAWADAFVKEKKGVNLVKRGQHAPDTEAKRKVVNEGRSPGVQMAIDFAQTQVEKAKETKKPIVTIASEVHAHIAARRGLSVNDYKMEKLFTIRRALEKGGMKLHPRERIKVDGAMEYVYSTAELAAEMPWDEIVKASVKAIMKVAPGRM